METRLFFSHLSKFEAPGSMAAIRLCPVEVEGLEAMAVSSSESHPPSKAIPC